MITIYSVLDLRRGLMSEDTIVSAKSPMDALKSLGYKNIVRNTEKYGGDVVVTRKSGKYMSYVYYCDKEEQREQVRKIL